MLPAEGIQLKVGLPAVGHLKGDGGGEGLALWGVCTVSFLSPAITEGRCGPGACLDASHPLSLSKD